MRGIRIRLSALTAGIAFCAIPHAVLAQGAAGETAPYPNRPIRLIVPFAPGGSTDTLARIIGQKLGERLGQQAVLDNRSGANGTIGTDLVAKAAPDGYTLGMAYVATLAINPAIAPSLPYDPVRDFAPIAQVTSSPNVLAVHSSIQAGSLSGFVALAKARPGALNYASGGVGTIGHLSAELLQHVAGIEMQHVVYKGSGQAVIDLLGGHVAAMFSGMSSVLTHAKAGKLKLLAVTGRQRSPAVPALPTIAESGYPGYEAVGWFGLVAPAGTPKAVVTRLNRETIHVLNLPDVHERLTGLGFDIVTSAPEEFTSYIGSEVAKWRKLVKQIGMQAN